MYQTLGQGRPHLLERMLSDEDCAFALMQSNLSYLFAFYLRHQGRKSRTTGERACFIDSTVNVYRAVVICPATREDDCSISVLQADQRGILGQAHSKDH